MSNSITSPAHISIPTGSPSDLALSQAVATGGYVNLNGSLIGTNGASFISSNYMRNISITDLSATDLSSMFFTIIGKQNGYPIQENLTGPTASGTVYSANYYDSITSIQASSSVTAIEVGSGNLSTIMIYLNVTNASVTPYTITLNNPDATVNTRIDALTYAPTNLQYYNPASDINYGTIQVKPSDASAAFASNFSYYTGDFQINMPYPVSALFVTVNDFPVVPVVVNYIQSTF